MANDTPRPAAGDCEVTSAASEPAEAERLLSAVGRLFGEGASAVRVVIAATLLVVGFVLSFLRVFSYWAGRTMDVPVFQIAGIILTASGFALMPTPPMRWQRWATGSFKVVCLFGAALNATVAVSMSVLLPLAAGLGPARWQGFHEALTAVRWATAIVLTWVVFLGLRSIVWFGRRWINLGWPTEDPENMKADLIIARDPETAREVRIAEEDRYMHMLIVGPTGSGKTASGLSPAVIQDIRNPDVGLTIVEPKGDWVNGDDGRPGIRQWAEYYGRKVFHIDPADPHTDVFNPLIGDRHMVAEVNSVALRVLFGSEINFFTHAQDALLKRTIYLLKWLRGDNLTYWDLHRAVRDFYLLVNLANELEQRLMYWEERGFPPNLTVDDILEAKDLVNWFRQEASGKRGEKLIEVTLGLRVQLDNVMNNVYFRRCIIPPPQPFRDEQGRIIGGRVIDLDRHLAMGSILTVSTNDGLLVELSKVLGRMILTAFQFAASRRFLLPLDQRPPHFIWIDEAATYLTPSWGEFQTKARGFGIGINLAIQNLAQLETVHRGFADIIVGQCRNRLIYGGLPPDDIEFWTKAFGTKEVEEVSYSESQRAMPVHYYPGEWIPLGPTSYNLFSSGKNRRTVERTKLSINEVLEQPRGRAVFQGVVGGNWQPPQIVAVDVVRTMPPRLRKAGGGPVYDPNEGVAVPSGPLLPPIPETVLAGTVTETVREKARRPARAEQPAAGGTSLVSRVGMLPRKLQAPPEPDRRLGAAGGETTLMPPPPAAQPVSSVEPQIPAGEAMAEEEVEMEVAEIAASVEGDSGDDAEEAGAAEEVEEAPANRAAAVYRPAPPPAPPSILATPSAATSPAPTPTPAPAPAAETLEAARLEAPPASTSPEASDEPAEPEVAPTPAPETPPAPVAPPAAPEDVVIAYGPAATEEAGPAEAACARPHKQQVLEVAVGTSQGSASGNRRSKSGTKPARKPPAPPAPRMEDIKVQPTFHGLERAKANREEKSRPRYREEPWE